MPELPEVETIRRDLQAVLPGRQLRRVEVRLAKMVKATPAERRRAFQPSRVVAVHRRAKLLLIHLHSGWTIVIHLKMSGQMIWVPTKGRVRVGGHPIPNGLTGLPNAYSHVLLHFTGGVLYFNDQRQFGYVRLIESERLNEWLSDQGYGPEPLTADFTVDRFLAILVRHRKKRVKPTLLDQRVIAGVGNIYADESCWLAGVRPNRRIMTITVPERRALWRGLRSIMNLSIKKRGTSADAYRDVNGEKGSMMPFLKVYGREGLPCRRRDGGVIQKSVLAGRGTHFCPVCQR